MNKDQTTLRTWVCFSLLLSALGLSSTVFAQRPTSQYFYDANGNLHTSVDGLNRVTTQQHDALNRLRRITQPPPGALQPNPVIRLELDGQGALTHLIDPRNLTTTYSVNGLGDVTEQSSPDTGVTVRTFKPGGQVATSRDARGQTTTYTYDALNRLTRARYEDGTASRYTYDQGVNGIGRLTGMVDPGGVNTAWTYDPHGRVLTQTQTVGQRTHELAYSYNSSTGQRMSMTYPSGKIVTYSYGAASKDLEAIQIDGAPIATSIGYHPFGGVKSFILGNGQAWSNGLDQDGRVVSYTLAGVTHSVDWDAANRITRIASPNVTTDQDFGYDNLDRITGFASASRSQAFNYDLSGNLLAKADVIASVQTDYTYSIDPASNRMTGISSLGIGYGFDAAGNRTDDGRITYVYNARGRLSEVRITDGATTQTFSYLINGLNLRVRKRGPNTVIPQGMRIFVYDDAARLIGEYDNLGRARVEHVWLEDRPIAVVTYSYGGTSSTTPTASVVSYVETDHLGTPRLISNVNRRARWSWVSAPYGDTFPNESPAGLNAFSYNLRFAGQYFDKETNHHYNHHRDYESTSGRYVQSDPIGLAGGWNTYAYVGSSPLRFIDPFGLLIWNSGPTSWADTVTTGQPYAPFPGAPIIQLPFNVGGATSLNWWIESACVCAAGGYQFNEFVVDVFIDVRLRSRYLGGFSESLWSRRAEGDHVADMDAWRNGDGKATAQRLENAMRGRMFSSVEECARVTAAALQQALAASAGRAVERSHNIHDATGRHTYSNPGRRP